jgi:hypothetical protein
VYGAGLAWAWFTGRALKVGELAATLEPKPQPLAVASGFETYQQDA